MIWEKVRRRFDRLHVRKWMLYMSVCSCCKTFQSSKIECKRYVTRSPEDT